MIKKAALVVAAMAGTAAADCPMGQIDAHLGVPIVHVDDGANSQTIEALSLGGTYCAIEHLELGGDYVFRLHPDTSGYGVVELHGTYYAINNAQMELGVAGALVFDFTDEGSPMGSTNFGLNVGAWFRYHINEQFSLFTGQPPAQPIMLGVGASSFLPLPPIPYQLEIGLNNSQPVSLNIPVGVSYSPVPEAHINASIDLFDFILANGGDKSVYAIFADFIPIAVSGWYQVTPQIDLGLEFADDLKHAGDFYEFLIAGRFTLGH